MKKYSFFDNLGVNPIFTNWRFVAPSQQTAELVIEASSEIHDFSLKKNGKNREKRDSPFLGSMWRWLDDDIIIINQLMHMYYSDAEPNENVLVKPDLFKEDTFDLRIYAKTQDDKDELLAMSEYLADYKIAMKGRGTNKPGSKTYGTFAHQNPAINQVFTWLKELHTTPDKVIINDTGWIL